MALEPERKPLSQEQFKAAMRTTLAALISDPRIRAQPPEVILAALLRMMAVMIAQIPGENDRAGIIEAFKQHLPMAVEEVLEDMKSTKGMVKQ